MYRQDIARKTEISISSATTDEVMSRLNAVGRIGLAAERDLQRLEELASRTNQFNTTGIRYGRRELQEKLKDPSVRIYVAELSDKFGDLGIVGAVFLKHE